MRLPQKMKSAGIHAILDGVAVVILAVVLYLIWSKGFSGVRTNGNRYPAESSGVSEDEIHRRETQNADSPVPTEYQTPPDIENPDNDLVTTPEASASATPDKYNISDKIVVIDTSSSGSGYISVKLTTEPERELRLQLFTPDTKYYEYRIGKGLFNTFALSGGDGMYIAEVYRHIERNRYERIAASTFDVVLDNEFAPFLHPNQYVNYSKDCDAARKATKLTEGLDDTVGKINAIYRYVVENITYDKELAAAMRRGEHYGYIPDVDDVLERGRGVAFDFVALLSAMLRSQGIPSKIVIGNAGSAYHTWVSVYSGTPGWIDDDYYFSGDSWVRLDPTFISTASTDEERSTIVEITKDETYYDAIYYY